MVISKTAKRKQRKAANTAAAASSAAAAAATVAAKNHQLPTGTAGSGTGSGASRSVAQSAADGRPTANATATGAESRRVASSSSGAGSAAAAQAIAASIGSPLRPTAASVARCAGTPGGIGPATAAAMDVVVTPMTPEAPKRTKVHAQRKFAQGQGCSTNYAPNQSLNASTRSAAAAAAAADASIMSTASASGFNSEPVDVLPNNIRPSTEDFLKFLCFRGTPVLPSHLDYFNNSNAAAAAQAAQAQATAAAAAAATQAAAAAAATTAAAVSAEAAAAASAHTASSSSPSATVATNTTTSGITVAGMAGTETALNPLTSADLEQSSSRQQSQSPPTPLAAAAAAAAVELVMPVAAGSASATSSNQTSFIPFAVRKQAETVSDGGKRRQAVKALKKKYQEQRMAKTQVQNLSKAKARITTRGGSRASPATVADATDAPQNTPNGSGGRSPVADVGGGGANLADPGATNMTTASSTCKSTPSKDYPPAAPSVADSLDRESIKTSDTKSTRRKAAAAARKEINHMPTRLTRQHALAYPESYRKAEQAALNSIKQSQAETQAAKQAKCQRDSLSVSKDIVKNSESASEFSSDDDQPLVKVIPSLSKSCKDEDSDARPAASKPPRASRGKEPSEAVAAPNDEDKKTNSGGARKPRAKRRTTSVEQSHELKMIIKTTAESVDSTSLASNDAQSQPSKRPKCASSMAESKDTVELKNATLPVPLLHEIDAAGGADSLGSSDETPTSKKKLMASIESVMKSFVEDSGWESGGLLMPANPTATPITAGATPTLLLCPPAKDSGSNQAPAPTEADAGRQSRARPSRKTKEAAAIYMELIGQRLNLDGGSDEDNASMGSLPELPNLRKTEQMELELRANIGKERSTASTSGAGPASATAGKKRLSAAAKHASPDLGDEAVESNGLSRRSGSQKPATPASTSGCSGGQKRKLERRNSRKQSDAPVEKLEKSFSESDEEPLAIKAAKVESTTYTPADALDIVSVSPATSHPIFQPPQTPHRRVDDPYARSNFPHSLSAYPTAVNSGTDDMPLRSPINYSPMPQKQSPPLHVAAQMSAGVLHLDIGGPRDVFDSPHGYPRTPSYQPSPFKTPAQQQQQQYSSPATQVSLSPVVSSRKDSQLFKSPTATPTSTKQQHQHQYPQQPQSPTTSTNRGLPHGGHAQLDEAVSPNANSTESVSAILANLMPSKEESCKIFGIASVSLAQSSGPNDTKCTLGKCGSVHKPPLGPVVPTEASAVLSDQMSNKERRKAKVNMTHEQIQKWLSECAVNQEMVDDLCDVDLTQPPEPVNYLSIASPVRDDSSSSGPAAQQPAETAAMPSSPANVTPTTKSTKASRAAVKSSPNRGKDSVQRNEVSSSTSMATRVASATRAVAASKASSEEPNNMVANIVEIMDTESPTKLTASPIPTRKATTPAPAPITPKTGSGSASTRSTPIPAIPTSTPNAKSTAVVYNPKRTPVYNSPIIVEPNATQRKPIVNTFGAFSPENESSIYSFDKDDDFTPASLKAGGQQGKGQQFKRNAKDNSKPLAAGGKAGQAKGAAGTSKTQQGAGSATLSPDEGSKSASIAVQVSLDSNVTPTKTTRSMTSMAASASADAVRTTSATKTAPSACAEELDAMPLDTVAAAPTAAAATTDAAGSHTFYIPLQGTHITGGKSDQIIQGVAVKLGTEGPEGPNQRVIMHAKLVTKNQMGANTSGGIPDALGNDIVKSLLVSSDGSGISTGACNVNRPEPGVKAVPVGTVQPRFKSSANAEAAADPPKSSIPLRLAYRPRPATEAPINPSNHTSFPAVDSREHAQMVEAPTFRPTEREFADPMEFFDRIYPLAARFGLCRVIPPASFRPECKISDDMRFTAYNQYVHKMLHRWGPSAKELCAIRKYLATQSVQLVHPPWIGGMEVDLPRLYHTVQELGGLKEVIEKKKWGRVAEEMCFPKTAQDRVSKLDDIYCKYLLPYDTLSPAERQKLFDEVEADWAKREAKARRSMQSNGEEDEDDVDDEEEVNAEPNNGKAKAGGKDGGAGAGAKRNADDADDDEDDEDDEDEEEEEEDDGAMECIVEGRKMPLKQFFRIARNTMALWFKNTEPTSGEIEAEFWRHVAVRDSHVCVHSGSIDSSGWGYGFPTPGPKGKQPPTAANAAQSAQTAACAKHPWNLKVLTNNHGSILRSIGPVTGVTVPTLHVGMLFSACCWYRDPHGLPWIEYLHTGGSKIWYGVPEEQSDQFREAFTSLVPTHCQSKTVWLPCDTAMVPPHMLTDRGVSLCRVEQEPGQFVIVFPRAYTSSLTTGYAISESVYFATSNWLDTAKEDFRDIHDSCEPAMFSLEQLLFAVASDNRTANNTLELVLPMMREVYDREKSERELIKSAGVTRNQKVPIKGSKRPHSAAANAAGAAGSVAGANATAGDDAECDTCRANLYISWIQCDDDAIYCLQHGLQQLETGRVEAAASRMLYAYSMSEIEQLMERIRVRTANAAATAAHQQQHSAAASSAAAPKPAATVAAAAAAGASSKTSHAKGRKPAAGKGR